MRFTTVPTSPETSEPMEAYLTCEQQLVRRHNSVAPYLRLEDPLCRAFLQQGANVLEFESIKLLFPFVREAAVLRVVLHQKHLNDWMYFAFFAGFDLGSRRPDLLQEVLPEHELSATRHRLILLQQSCQSERATGFILHQAFGRVVQNQWPEILPEQLEAVFAKTALKAMRTGFAAATIAQLDPQFCDFYGVFRPDEQLDWGRILWNTWLGVLADSIGLAVVQRLEHPLLRISAHHHPDQPTQCAVVKSFLCEFLSEYKGSSENECPTLESDLIYLIVSGIEHGQRVQREHPEIVQLIFAELGEQRLNASLDMVRNVVGEARSTNPIYLRPALQRWQKRVYDQDVPHFYGQAVERVALFANIAIWIPWATSQAAAKA